MASSSSSCMHVTHYKAVDSKLTRNRTYFYIVIIFAVLFPFFHVKCIHFWLSTSAESVLKI